MLLLQDAGQLRVNGLVFAGNVHVAVMNQDEAVVLVAGRRRQLQDEQKDSLHPDVQGNIQAFLRRDSSLPHRADVHGLAAACRFDHGLQALGCAEQNPGLVQVVLLFRLQSRLQVLLLSALQELQLLNSWRQNADGRFRNNTKL